MCDFMDYIGSIIFGIFSFGNHTAMDDMSTHPDMFF